MISESPRIFIDEEQSATPGHWRQAEFRDRTVVCLNAHLDLKQVPEEQLALLASIQNRGLS